MAQWFGAAVGSCGGGSSAEWVDALNGRDLPARSRRSSNAARCSLRPLVAHQVRLTSLTLARSPSPPPSPAVVRPSVRRLLTHCSQSRSPAARPPARPQAPTANTLASHRHLHRCSSSSSIADSSRVWTRERVSLDAATAYQSSKLASFESSNFARVFLFLPLSPFFSSFDSRARQHRERAPTTTA